MDVSGGRSERIFVVSALVLWALLSGCASTPAGDPDPRTALGGAPELDCALVDAGFFFVPADSRGRIVGGVRDRILSLGYDDYTDLRRRVRRVNVDGRTREIVEGWEGTGLRYRDPACRHRGIGDRA